MRRTIVGLLAVLACALPSGSRANDPTTELGIGGLQLVRNEAVELLSEDLFVSPTEVRVTYKFRNKTDAAVAFLIAFPLPALDASTADDVNVELPKPESDNFVDFEVKVDGQPVTATIAQRVIALGLDRTAEIRALGLPLNPLGTVVDERIKALPADNRAELHAIGLITIDGDDIQAAWKLETTFYWQQTFPPGKEITVEHRYKPVVGNALFTAASLEEDHDHHTNYCFDEAFIRAAKAKLAAVTTARNPALAEQRISYILTTAKNWASTIKTFRVVVDKGDPDALASFCLEGLRRVSPTRFEFKAQNYEPSQELEILIVTAPKAP